MKILVIGEVENLKECKARFGDSHTYMFETDHREAGRYIETNDIVFDFIIDEEPFQIDIYKDKTQCIIFLNSSKVSLTELSNLTENPLNVKLFGFNGLPTFLDRKILEVCVLKPEHITSLKEVCDRLETEYLVVDDRVGMVTPRVVCMIINEAYYTVQEGTASREDIDKAMKLGTNYPYGPFEWGNRIGIKHVYELLEALYEDTHDDRYKICSLLKKEYMLH